MKPSQGAYAQMEPIKTMLKISEHPDMDIVTILRQAKKEDMELPLKTNEKWHGV